MNTFFGIKKEKIFELWHLFARNVFLLVNAIIFSVSILLIYYGNTKEGIFLGIIIFVNISLGLAQDIHVWLTLERLRLLTVVKILRLNNDESTTSVSPEDIQKNDKIIIHLGDQVPCDGTVIDEKSFEVSESLITGESLSFLKKVGETVLGGSIVTSGTATVSVNSTFQESRLAKMTEKIKRYSENLSPIQIAVEKMVKYSGYVLIGVIFYIVYRGDSLGQSGLSIIKIIGALASTIVPQGLVIATTLLFAYGSVRMFQKHVLLQDVNATEKLGRIKNLCLDKTGTLTENILTVMEMHVPPGISQEEAKYLSSTYLSESGDSSESVFAIKKYLGPVRGSEVSEALSFSSERSYGLVILKHSHKREAVLMGAPEIFISHLAKKSEKEWLELLMDSHALSGKRIIAVVKAAGIGFTRNLKDSSLSLVAVYILNNNLRPGIRDTVDFFQKRGVFIRIISGDNPETVKTIASLSGVHNSEKMIIGNELEKWSKKDYLENTSSYTIFARIKPEQKEKIIEALKKDGFTAMIGDGANDALAIKKADIGIAMFDGAPATRQIASVVLTNNSFAELPGGVKMADSIIKNIEIFAGIFLNQTFVGFFLFLWISFLGFSYPLTPLNVTLINYFAIGLPGLLVSYWAIRPIENGLREKNESFLKRVLPFPFFAAFFQSVCIMGIYMMNINSVSAGEMRTLMVISFASVGYIFFLFSSRVYEGHTSTQKKFHFLWLGILEIMVMLIVFLSPILSEFFNVVPIPLVKLNGIVLFVATFSFVHFFFVWWFFPTREEE